MKNCAYFTLEVSLVCCHYYFFFYLISWLCFPGQTSLAPSGSLQERSANLGTQKLKMNLKTNKQTNEQRYTVWWYIAFDLEQVKVKHTKIILQLCQYCFLLTRDACLVYNSFNFAFFHRLLDGLRSLYHGLWDLLCGTGCKGEDVILTCQRGGEKKEEDQIRIHSSGGCDWNRDTQWRRKHT